MFNYHVFPNRAIMLKHKFVFCCQDRTCTNMTFKLNLKIVTTSPGVLLEAGRRVCVCARARACVGGGASPGCSAAARVVAAGASASASSSSSSSTAAASSVLFACEVLWFCMMRNGLKSRDHGARAHRHRLHIYPHPK